MSYIKDGIHRTEDDILVRALYALSGEIVSNDGVANGCISEAALRLEELIEENKLLKDIELFNTRVADSNSIPKLYTILGNGRKYGYHSADFYPFDMKYMEDEINAAIEYLGDEEDYKGVVELLNDYKSRLYRVVFPERDTFMAIDFDSGEAAKDFIFKCNKGEYPEFTEEINK